MGRLQHRGAPPLLLVFLAGPVHAGALDALDKTTADLRALDLSGAPPAMKASLTAMATPPGDADGQISDLTSTERPGGRRASSRPTWWRARSCYEALAPTR